MTMSGAYYNISSRPRQHTPDRTGAILHFGFIFLLYHSASGKVAI